MYHPDWNRRDDPDRKFIQSRLWREKLRPRQLTRFPLCEHCSAVDRLKAAEEVDHIVRPRGVLKLQMGWDNLQSLCVECHQRKSAWERSGAGRGLPLVLGVTIEGEKIIASPRGDVKHLRAAR
jgi:5-methylcytosine-specific restriction endonuclease McrA